MDEVKQFDVIVVGAGTAGLTASAYLCRKGARVLVCERNQQTGGLVNSFSYEGFTFDGGIRAFENSGILLPMLRQLGIEIEFHTNPVTLGIGEDLIKLRDKQSLSDYEKLLLHHFPDEAIAISGIMKEISQVMSHLEVIYGIDNPLFHDNLQDLEYLRKTLLPWLIRYQRNIGKALRRDLPVREHLRRFTNNISLIDVIVQHFFKDTPAFFALSYFGFYLDYSYPMGGTGILTQKLTEYIKEHQGVIRTGTGIEKVDLARKRVCSEQGDWYGYETLIWACDLKHLYRATDPSSLTGKTLRGFQTQKELVQQHQGGDSILTVYLGLDVEKAELDKKSGAHCFYTPDPFGITSVVPNGFDTALPKAELQEQLSAYLEHTTYEISCPVLRDPTLAPVGKAGLMVSTLMDYRVTARAQEEGWYEEFKTLCMDRVTEVLDRTLYKGMMSKVLFRFCATPLTIERRNGSAEGAITGWAFARGRMPVETRMKKIRNSIRTPLPDVLQAGQWSFSPSGLPVCVLTGKLAADQCHSSRR